MLKSKVDLNKMLNSTVKRTSIKSKELLKQEHDVIREIEALKVAIEETDIKN